MRKINFVLIIVSVLLCGCALQVPESGTSTPYIITATLPPTAIPPETPTSTPPTPSPTAIPIDGVTSTQVNVRDQPSTAGTVLGIIAAAVRVHILGKDASGNWYQILYSQAATGKGWVTSEYIVVTNKDAIPVIGVSIPGSAQNGIEAAGSTGTIIEQVNVRDGPSTDSKTLGILQKKDVVTLTGKVADASWLQIQYTAGPEGKGWVTAAYVQANGLDNLPIVAQSGEVVGTGTAISSPPTTTPMPIAAMQDNDSALAPGASAAFSPSGARSLIYSSDVSAPDGDLEDWVEFTPYGSSVMASLLCSGNGKLKTELLTNGAVLQNWAGLTCGESRQLRLTAGQSYLMHISAVPDNSSLEYVLYTLSVESVP